MPYVAKIAPCLPGDDDVDKDFDDDIDDDGADDDDDVIFVNM